MAHHTEGPWQVVSTQHPRGYIVSARDGNYDIAIVRDVAGSPENYGNAQLVVAAPDMLEALKAEEEWQARNAVGEIDPEWDYEEMVGSKRRAALAKAHSVLA